MCYCIGIHHKEPEGESTQAFFRSEEFETLYQIDMSAEEVSNKSIQ